MNLTFVVTMLLATALAFPAAPAAAKGKAKKRALPNSADRAFDVTPVKDLLHAATDGKGRYLVFIRIGDRKKLPKKWPLAAVLWYSRDGKNFYMNYSNFSARSRTDFTYDFRDARHTEDGARKTQSMVRTLDNGDTLQVLCNQRKTGFKRLPDAQAAALISKSKFFHPLWNRIPQFLARNDSAVYFFVDNARYPERSRDWRVYRGMRGTMTYLPLKGVADDSAGQIFATRKGNLRLVIPSQPGGGRPMPQTAEWIKGKTRTPLTILPILANLELVFNELGPYLGQRLGTPCDDM